jgi:hypothetical protein
MNFALSKGVSCAVALAMMLASSAPTFAVKEPSHAAKPHLVQPRVIHIGPQATVSVDAHGNVAMVDEPPVEQTLGDVARGVLGVMGLGVIFLVQGQTEQTFGGTSAVRR